MPRACCRVCHKLITISPSGVELGHQRHAARGKQIEGRCPHRPASVDPDPSTGHSAGGRARWGDV